MQNEIDLIKFTSLEPTIAGTLFYGSVSEALGMPAMINSDERPEDVEMDDWVSFCCALRFSSRYVDLVLMNTRTWLTDGFVDFKFLAVDLKEKLISYQISYPQSESTAVPLIVTVQVSFDPNGTFEGLINPDEGKIVDTIADDVTLECNYGVHLAEIHKYIQHLRMVDVHTNYAVHDALNDAVYACTDITFPKHHVYSVALRVLTLGASI